MSALDQTLSLGPPEERYSPLSDIYPATKEEALKLARAEADWETAVKFDEWKVGYKLYDILFMCMVKALRCL